MPYPDPFLFPESSLLLADDIPRCASCSAFFNKFNKYNSTQYQCSLCGHKNNFKIPNTYKTRSQISAPQTNAYVPNFGGFNENNGVFSAELKHEVYDANAKIKFKPRSKNFVPTTFFYISLSLMKTNPEIFSRIDCYLQECFQVRQIGLCFLHGALTLVKHRPFLEFQTYFDDAPECRAPLYYVTAPYFRKNFQKIINKSTELSYIEECYEDSFVKNVIEHSKKISLFFGTEIFFILDERDFSLFSSEANKDLIKRSSLEMLKSSVQASCIAFTSQNRMSLNSNNPLLDFSVITGGIFKVFPDYSFNNMQTDIENMYNEFQNILNWPCLNDTFVFVCPPANVPLKDFAGQGMMKSHTGISMPKIKLKDCFSFKFDPGDAYEFPYVQVVTYFTTNDNVRKMRVATIPIMEYKPIDTLAQSVYSSIFVAQRFLNEGKEEAKKVLDSCKKYFPNLSCQSSEIVLSSADFRLASRLALMAFNGALYGSGTQQAQAQYQQQAQTQYQQQAQTQYQQQFQQPQNQYQEYQQNQQPEPQQAEAGASSNQKRKYYYSV